jgi:UDP-GlcNAc:undecaprenyl-phosphate/decaprenyl-phosphate GlcNAc-1-phosphate transferase
MLTWITDLLKSLGIARPSGMGWLTVLLTFVLAALCAWLVMPSVRAFALKTGWADLPNSRRLNRRPVPNAGGLVIFVAVLTALVLATLLRPIIIDQVKVQVLAILLGGSLLVFVGFVDDQYGLSPWFRLVVQLLAALLLVVSGIRVEVSFGGGVASLISALITIVWVMAITNALNLIDGVDGLAGGVSLITALCLVAVSAQFEARAAASLLLAALGGAALGFLRHNLRPNFIIMGDSGAYFFGYALAASSILGTIADPSAATAAPRQVNPVLSLLPTLLFLLIPLVDTSQVIVRRLLRRQNPLSSPGQDHLHHRLMAHGVSQRNTVFILWAAALVGNLAAMLVMGMSWLVIGVTALGAVLLLALVALPRPRPAPRDPSEAAPSAYPR